MTNSEYTSNHYVPTWYQKRFIPQDASSQEYYYLNLKPEQICADNGRHFTKRAMRRLGPRQCFCSRDLYTTTIQGISIREIEMIFFGQVDQKGREAVQAVANFEHGKTSGVFLVPFLRYLSLQKLRTPKGLGWLAQETRHTDKNSLLEAMVHFQNIFCALWAEAVWLIADADQSETKFIISDHPVTVYNRRCGPRSTLCRGYNDPEIWLNGTHTYFPLSSNKILILTNLSWVRNPYQNPILNRPNPNPFRDAIFKVLDIQVDRHLSEQEVRQINFITKQRAHKYIAAEREEWLYPEKHVSKSDWSDFQHGYLLMPDPRSVIYSGEILLGFKGGRSTGFDSFGRRPGDPDYNKDYGDDRGTFEKFQGEFANLFGPYRRGRSCSIVDLDPEKDSEMMHKAYLRQFSSGKTRF